MSSLFGNPPAANQQPQQQTSIFGAPLTSAPSQAPAPGGLFGPQQPQQNATQPATGGIFGNLGQTTQQGQAGTTTGGGMFGNTGGAPAAGTSLFGNPNAGQQQQQPGGGLFANTNTAGAGTAGSSLFGNTATNTGTSLFGNSTAGTSAPANAGGGLFANTATAQGAPAGSSLFGTANTGGTGTTGNLFGNTNPAGNAGGGLFSNTNTAGAGGGLFSNTGAGTSGGGLFANTNTGAPGAGGGLFSNTGANNTGGGLFANTNAGGTSGGGLFANTNMNPGGGGLFSNPQQGTGGGIFGNTQQQQQQQQQQQGGIFGGFGQNNQHRPAQGPLFGNAQPQAGGSTLFGQNTLGTSTLGTSALGGSILGQPTLSGLPSLNTSTNPLLASRALAPSQQSQDPQAQFTTLVGRIEGIYKAWSPSSPDCRFQHYFYNLVDPSEVHRYTRPPNATNEALWQKAVRENPDPTCLVPALACGFDDLQQRVEAQSQQAAAHQERIKELKSRIQALSQKHELNNSARSQRIIALQTQLTQRVMRIVQHLHLLIPALRSSSIRAEEEALGVTLENIAEEIKRPGGLGKLKGKLNELWAIVGALNATRARDRKDNGSGWAVVDEEGLAQIAQILANEQAGLAYVMKVLQRDLKDLNVIEGKPNKEESSDAMLVTSTRGASAF